MNCILILTLIIFVKGSTADIFDGLLKQGKYNKIPNFIHTCRRSDPDLNGCIKQSVERIRPYLVRGIPELGIPPCEPLVLPEIVMNQGRGSVQVQSTYNNIHVHGASEFSLESIKVELDKDRVKIKLYIPQLRTIGDYFIQGKILMLPIIGRGISTGNYSDIEALIVMQGEKVIKDGQVYFNVIDFFVDFSIGHAQVHLSDLFDGDEELGDAMNQFLNDNWRNVAQEMKPILEKTIGDLFKKFANKIYHKFPLDQLLPY